MRLMSTWMKWMVFIIKMLSKRLNIAVKCVANLKRSMLTNKNIFAQNYLFDYPGNMLENNSDTKNMFPQNTIKCRCFEQNNLFIMNKTYITYRDIFFDISISK